MKKTQNDAGIFLNIRDFGAKGNGRDDDSGAIQDALNAAAAKNGTVFVPDGVYCCSDIIMPPHTGIVGNATWGYRGDSGSVLRLNSDKAACLLNVTGAVGATVNRIMLEARGEGHNIHGIFQDRFEGRKEEDAPRFECCKVTGFSGDGIHLEQAWCFSLRHSHLFRNKGDGLYLNGWDAFVLDNWFSGNEGAGIAGRTYSSSVTITGNRIEWNRGGGIYLVSASHYNITGNYIDRSGGPGITLLKGDGAPCFCIAMTGNVIYRSGKPEWGSDGIKSSHVLFDGAHGITFTSNTMCVGQDDGGGVNSPQYGIVLKDLQNSIIKDNALHIGALQELIHDLGGHGDGVIIKDNVGSLFSGTESIWSSGQI